MKWFVRAVVVIVLLGVAKGSLLYSIVEEQLQSRRSQNSFGKGCALDTFKHYNLTTDCNGTSVADGANCHIRSDSLDQTEVAHCEDGQWIRGATLTDDSTSVRRKRFFFLIPLVFCIIFCRKRSNPKKAPYYTNCQPIRDGTIFEAEEGKTSKVISWTHPTANDDDGSIRSDKQTSTPKNGQRFSGRKEGQRYTVEYEAEDNHGLLATCSFTFIVKVLHCNCLPYPRNGRRNCDNGTIYGSTCRYSCISGYQLTHGAVSKCQKNRKWSVNSVTSSCTKVKCQRPPTVTNGSYHCDDSSYSYQSKCFLNCNTGFTLQGHGIVQCKADKKWNLFGSSSCRDTTPPTFTECITPQIFYADFGALNTSATWNTPQASDAVDPNPTIQQVDGPSQGDILEVGSRNVEYIATDASGNISPKCVVELRVQEIRCDDPRTEFDEYKMIPVCTDSRYYFGVYCDISCDYKLPLNGSSTITCNKTVVDGMPVGVWDWGKGFQPHCVEITCPALDPPINGALVSDSFSQRPLMIIMCNEQFDIPVIQNFHGYMICRDSGKWFPVSKTPDCTETRNPDQLRLPSEMYYFSGKCGNATTQETIKNNFLQIVADKVYEVFKPICPSNITCVVENVHVQCRSVSRMKRSMENSFALFRHYIVKREETHATILSFDITTDIQQDNVNFTEALNAAGEFQKLQKEALRILVNNHTFDIDGHTIREDSFQTALKASFKCKRGQALDGNVCKPCPQGMYLDEDEGICLDCPFGFYQDIEGETSCKRCPSGFSTLQTRSKQEFNCTKLCSPGSVSSTSMEPCSPCAIGSYQDTQGQEKCLKCPRGQTTTSAGRSNVKHCQYFDVKLGSTNGDELLGTISLNSSFSIMFWTSLLSENAHPHASFKLKVGQSYVFIINMTSTIAVHWGEVFQTNTSLSTARWNHVAFVWNETRSTLKVYVDGQLKTDEAVVPPSFDNGYFVIDSQGSEGIYVSGLHAIGRDLDEMEISSFLTTCTKDFHGNLISMDAFVKRRSNSIQVVMPSICDAIDECASLPCGEHKCINEAGDYRCVCNNGRTGRNCEIAPDYCQNNDCKNGATCMNQELNYTCSCKIGYLGDFCEVPPVNGSWSDWSEWTECSVSCGGGETIRSRTCDEPEPGIGGRNCSGPNMQSQICNPEKCRECGRPWRSYGIIPNCTTDLDMSYCHPYCRNGTILPMGVYKFDVYSCGANTNFTWIPFTKFPDCVDPSPPSRYQLDVAIDYAGLIPSNDKKRVETIVRDNLKKTECSNLAGCEMNIAVDNSQKRQKQNGSTLDITMTVPITHTSDLGAEAYLTNGTVSEGLQEIVDAIVALELTAADIQANASELLSVQGDGMSYTIDESSLVVSGESECPSGQVETEGLCTKCPVGTRAVEKECGYCEVGSYQDGTGQSFCKQCPVGFTTETIGAEGISDCYIVLTEESDTLATPKIALAPTDDANLTIGMIVGISIGCVGGILILVTIVTIYRKRTWVHKKYVLWSKSSRDKCHRAAGPYGNSSKQDVYEGPQSNRRNHLSDPDNGLQNKESNEKQLGPSFSNSAYDCMSHPY